MNQIRRILIACALIVGAVAITRGANEKESISQDIERSPEKHIDALQRCECTHSTDLNLEYTYWCLCLPHITINDKLRSEGDTIHGFKIISITKETIVFLCPEGHSLELKRPTERVLIGEPLEGDVPIGRQLETGLVQQTPEPLPELSADYGCECQVPVFTFDGKDYHEGDMVKGHTIIEIRKTEVVFRDPQGEEVITYLYDYLDDSSHIRKSNQASEVETVPQNIEHPLITKAVYWNPTNIVVTTVGGQKYSVGDTVNGFTIIDNKIWFADPMGDTAVTPFYDPSYYRKLKQSSEVESDGGDDPQIH